MNKLMKKILAVAMAGVVFCGLSAPVTAEAAVCTHEFMFQTEVETGSSSYTHQYSARYDVDNDGDIDSLSLTCVVEVVSYSLGNVCTKCNQVVSYGPTIRTEEVHSDEHSPFHP